LSARRRRGEETEGEETEKTEATEINTEKQRNGKSVDSFD
jgi:hypothetical protein